MEGLFISYSREDSEKAIELEKVLKKRGIRVWHDQENIYAGEQWPKAIGEGIADQQLFLLLWSKYSVASHFVELEWNTALALKKTIVPVFLDDTPLPPALSAQNGVPLSNFDRAVKKIQAALKKSPPPDPHQNRRVIETLDQIKDKSIETVLDRVKTVYQQQGWQVYGNVFQVTGGNIVVNLLSKWQTKIIVLAALLIFLSLLFEIPKKASDFFDFFGKSPVICKLTGVVVDAEGMPIAGAEVSLDELPGESVTTTSDGSFKINKIPRKVGESVRVRIYYKGLHRDEYVTLPGPKRFVLKKEEP